MLKIGNYLRYIINERFQNSIEKKLACEINQTSKVPTKANNTIKFSALQQDYVHLFIADEKNMMCFMNYCNCTKIISTQCY